MAAERLIVAGGARRFEALYACGPEPMLAAVERLAQAHHLPAQLSYERDHALWLWGVWLVRPGWVAGVQRWAGPVHTGG